MIWISDPTGTVARMLRRDIRAHRREKGRDGHRFRFSEIDQLYAGYLEPLGVVEEPPVHVAVRHTTIDPGDVREHEPASPMWQHWAHHPEKGWLLIHWWDSLSRAQLAADDHTWDPEEVSHPDSGIYVLAGWGPQPTMKVRCGSKNIAIAVADAFRAVGCNTAQEVI